MMLTRANASRSRLRAERDGSYATAYALDALGRVHTDVCVALAVQAAARRVLGPGLARLLGEA